MSAAIIRRHGSKSFLYRNDVQECKAEQPDLPDENNLKVAPN